MILMVGHSRVTFSSPKIDLPFSSGPVYPGVRLLRCDFRYLELRDFQNPFPHRISLNVMSFQESCYFSWSTFPPVFVESPDTRRHPGLLLLPSSISVLLFSYLHLPFYFQFNGPEPLVNLLPYSILFSFLRVQSPDPLPIHYYGN